MDPLVTATDPVQWFMLDLTSRVVADSGIPSDRYHLGKIILQSLKDAPNFILQIDAATGKSENFKSALERSVRCALSLKKMGLKYGDVMAIISPHYLELAILYYAALYLGIKIAIMDPSFELFEVKEMFQVNRAKIIFCLNDKISVVKEAIKQIDLKAKIVSFDEGSDEMSIAKFIEECGDVDVYAVKKGSKYPTPFDRQLLAAPVLWMTAMLAHLSAPILRFTKIQTSAAYSAEHFIDVINKYRPQSTCISPAAMFSIINTETKHKVDLTCFQHIAIGGSPVPQQLCDDIQKLTPQTLLLNGYGSTEVAGAILRQAASLGCLGSPMGCYDVRLVDPETLKDITEPYINGELWLKGPSVSKGYLNNPTETKATFLDDGWLRTGDIFYRDEEFSFYYVDRLKLLLKYRTYHVSPTELEKVIHEHPGVLDVVVVGIPDLECGDLPAACIVPHPDNPPTAQEIKDFVKEKLSDAKQLRGGVIFMEEFPLTKTSKVDRMKLRAIALTASRQ